MDRMKESNPKIAIVDCFSAAQYYPAIFRDNGWEPIHVQSSANIPDIFRTSSNLNSFEINLVHDGKNLNDIVLKLKNIGIRCVIAGAECGVNLADTLSNELNLIGNGVELSEARRNKHKMSSEIEKKGLRVIPQKAVKSIHEAFSFAHDNGYPLIIKPVCSAGTDNVWRCNSSDELKNSFNLIIDKSDIFSKVNEEVLIQKYIKGVEYVVNHVSCGKGYRKLTSVWRYKKKLVNGQSIIYDRDDLCDPNGKIEKEVIKYTEKVLDALGICYGPSHAEIMYDNEPVLIEVGARLDGATNPSLLEISTGINPVSFAVESYVDPDRFREKRNTTYKIYQHATTVSLIANREGIATSLSKLSDIEKLDSYFDSAIYVSVGDYISKTVDMKTLPGIVYLASKDIKDLDNDYQKIRSLENPFLF